MDQTLVSSSWVEHFQTGWPEVEEIQPLLQNPQEHYRYLRDLFALTQVGEEATRLKALEAFRLVSSIPWGTPFYPTELLRSFLEKQPPIVPLQYPSGAAPLFRGGYPKMAESCQLALLWALKGESFEGNAAAFAGWLLPLIEERFFSLWSSDSQFDEKETRLSCALLLRACGREEEAEKLYSQDLPKNPFFAFLFHSNVRIEPKSGPLHEPALGFWMEKSKAVSAALTLCGHKSGVGAFRVGKVEIPSFGPQTAPLSDSNFFGIHTVFSNEGWFRAAALKESWFRIESKLEENRISFQWGQVGIDPKGGALLSFYIRSDLCKIDGKVFKPKSLQRFLGEASSAEFERGGSSATLVVERPLKFELIPLAGEGCFWGASFLLALWLPSFDGPLSFQWVAK